MIDTLQDYKETLRLISVGGDVIEKELDAAAAYAKGNWTEIAQLLDALIDGFKSLQAELVRKDQVIEARNARIHNLSEALAKVNGQLRAAKELARKEDAYAE